MRLRCEEMTDMETKCYALLKLRGLKIFCMAALCMLLGTVEARAGKITDDMRSVVERLVNVLTDPTYAAGNKKQERDRLLHAIASERFDWEEMARRCIGVRWRDLNDQQRKEFTEVFVDFLERTYLSKIDLFLQKTKDFSARNITYDKETVEGSYAMIESTIRIQDQSLPLAYKMIQKKGLWMVYDVVIEGVGLVANYRSQFNEILARESFDSLIKRLRDRNTEQHTGDPLQQRFTDNGTHPHSAS